MGFKLDGKMRFKMMSSTAVSVAQIKIAAQDVLYQNTDKFIEAYLKGEIDSEVAEFNKKDVSAVPEDELKTFTDELKDYFSLSHAAKEELSQYMLVAAYSAYERGLKKILELTGKLTTEEIRSCFRKKDAVKLLKDKFGIVYADMADNTLIEELRCLNNDIKHNGAVGIELAAANPKWTRYAALGNTYSDFQRLCNAPRNFLGDLAAKIELTL